MQPTFGVDEILLFPEVVPTRSCQPRAIRGNGFAVKRRNLYPLKIAKSLNLNLALARALNPAEAGDEQEQEHEQD